MIITTHSIKHPLVNALIESGVSVKAVGSPQVSLENIGHCVAYFGNMRSDLKKPLELYNLVRSLKKNRIPYIFWNRDAPSNEAWKTHRMLTLRLVKPVDIYLAHSPQRSGLFSSNVTYFPNAAQLGYYSNTNLAAMRDESEYLYDISFVGAVCNREWPACRKRVDFFNEIRSRISSRFPGVRFKVFDTSTHSLNEREQTEIIRKTKINLNYAAVCDLPHELSWGLPERVFGIPAAGGFLLTDFREMTSQTFDEDAVDQFSNAEDCAAKIMYYLSHFDLLRSRAEILSKKVTEAHTYQNRAGQLLKIIGNYNPNSLK